jgi:hypothetical protein
MTNLFATPEKTTPVTVTKNPSMTLSKTARRSISGRYVHRDRDPNEAMPPENDIFKRGVYRTGDGDTNPYVPRPGSMVAFSLPSRA